MNLYYRIWADGLIAAKKQPENEGLWKFYAFLFITLGMAFNFATVITIFQAHILDLGYRSNLVDSGRLGNVIGFFTLYYAPPGVVNYLLIFRSKKYETLLQFEGHSNGKLAGFYVVGSLFAPIVLLLVGYFITEVLF